ncbi:DUF4254 domain-containing protein [Nocardia sp. NPDC059236]
MAEELLAAIHGHGMAHHSVVRWGKELADLHLDAQVAGEDELDDINLRRSELIHEIDLWTNRNVPQHRSGVRMHTETIGSVVDKIAEACIRLVHGMITWDIAGAEVRGACNHLAEVVLGYRDLVAEVVQGQRRLPMLGGH